MSTFDTETFLNATYEQANSTRLPLVPAGEYKAEADRINVRQGEIKEGENSGDRWYRLELLWSIDSDKLKTQLKMDKVAVKQSFFLDVTDSGTLDMGEGKNVSLGRLRESLGMNNSGRRFSISSFKGAMATIRVDNKMADRDGGALKKGDMFAEVGAVTRI